MDNFKKLYVTRLEQWSNRLKESLFAHTYPLHAEHAVSKTPVLFNERLSLKYKPSSKGQTWGNPWDSAWFYLTADIPSTLRGSNLIARIDLGGEGLVYNEQGVPILGLTNSSVFEPRHKVFKRQHVLLKPYIKRNRIALWIEVAAHELFGIETEEDPKLTSSNLHGSFTARVSSLEYCEFDQELWNFAYDIDVLVGLVKALDEKSVRHAKLLQSLMDAAAVYADSRKNLANAKKITDSLLATKATPSSLTAVSVGHAHIDTAWLWPMSETIRKCARTFSSQIDLLERYPNYVFGASSPQHYQFIKDYYPTLYPKIKKFVKEGRWELQGGMWIEADCNLPSGESLVRQFIYGKNFFLDEFGIEVTNTWIPDVFGYSAALPQIMKKARIQHFLTQKISWSQFNGFPHHTFIWQGIDGSEILTHFPPEDSYNSLMTPDTRGTPKGIVKAQEDFREKGFLDQFMVLYGVGDGGGGPTDEMIERGQRMAHLEGAPKVKFGTAHQLFKYLETQAHKLQKWVGELYLEYHRGTLTSQAKVKKYNRRLEFTLQALEKLSVLVGSAQDYPREQLNKMWKTLLLNQFHDIIPGSSIHKVYEVTHKEYETLEQEAKKLFKLLTLIHFKKNDHALILFNSHSYDTEAIVRIPDTWKDHKIFDVHGNEIPTQGNAIKVHLAQLDLLCLYKGTQDTQSKRKIAKQKNLILENDLIRYEFDVRGQLKKVFDKEAKKSVLAGKGNIFTLYEDRPHAYDAWDIDIYYENCVKDVLKASSYELGECDSLFSQIKFNYTFGDSSLTQEVTLYTHSKLLEFKNTIDWNERHSLLKVHFNVDIHAAEACYDIQYAYLKRPTHRNTSWNKAMFEVCGHKYADISDAHYGVALLNDCKYGYKIHEQILELSILRSPTHPDPLADRGVHSFAYALLPHQGTLTESSVMKEATSLNQEVLVFQNMEFSLSLQNTKNFRFKIDNNIAISVDVIKRGETSNDIYVRLVERFGHSSKCKIVENLGHRYFVETDLLEWHETGTHKHINIPLHFSPFEIKTIKLIK